MKTTLDLPDDLLIKAKILAAQRKTTLKAIVESALIREVRPAAELENPDPDKYEVGPFGILSLKRTDPKKIAEEIQHLIDHQYDEEDARVIAIATGKP
ncbi:MAG: hypothetical protein IAE94_05625 [Chthoniobacterales bacterium]|nr:hypothetical protein [Chthoniobacterales bacterium]